MPYGGRFPYPGGDLSRVWNNPNYRAGDIDRYFGTGRLRVALQGRCNWAEGRVILRPYNSRDHFTHHLYGPHYVPRGDRLDPRDFDRRQVGGGRW